MTDSVLEILLCFDELERQAIDVLDEDGACVTEPVRSLENRDVLCVQMSNHSVEVRIGEPDVIDDLSSRARQRSIVARAAAARPALTRVPEPTGVGNPRVTSGDAQLPLFHVGGIG